MSEYSGLGKIWKMPKGRMRRNYFIGFMRKFDGVGIMLHIDPPYTTVRRSWCIEIKMGWFKFWYVKEKRKCA